MLCLDQVDHCDPVCDRRCFVMGALPAFLEFFKIHALFPPVFL